MRKIIYFISIFLPVFAMQIQAQTENKIFSGAIGESRIQMNLERNGNNLSGTYFYIKIGKELKISGTINKDGNFILTETAPTGAKTGEFKGLWSKDAETDSLTLNGTWTNPQASKTLDFYLGEQMIYLTNGAKLTPKVFTENNKAKLFEITVEYPELSGVSIQTASKFNEIAKSLAMNEAAKFRKDLLAQTAEDLKFIKETGGQNTVDISYNITHADNEIISVGFGTYFYTGGAHPNSYSYALNFDLENGRKLKLADLFKPNSNYLKVLSDYCIKNLKQQLAENADNDWIEKGAGATAENYKSWNLTTKGITITFDSYQVAPYAAGPQEVIVPFEHIESILREDFAGMK